MTSKIDLEKKTILIAGAAGRIGREIVLGALESGANIVALDTDEEALQELKEAFRDEPRFRCAIVDISKPASMEAIFRYALAEFGAIDGAVCTAYPRNANYGRKFFDVTYTDFCENTALHLGSYFLFMQRCAAYAKDSPQKFSLVNLSSIYGVMAPRFEVYSGTEMTMPVEYAAIKSGLIHLTRYVCAYMKGSSFRANCVSPGGIQAGQDIHFLARYNQYCRSKGILDSKDIVGTIIYLLSDASEFVVGQNIVVDDGFSI